MPIDPGEANRDRSHGRSFWNRLSPMGITPDLVLESILVSLVAGYFFYLLLAVKHLRPEAARLPRMTAIGGLLLVVAFIAQKIWRAMHGKPNATRQILDTGFDEEGLSNRLIVGRTLRLSLWFGGMLAAIWLVGYHVAIPLFVFFYLLVFGNTKWWLAATAGAGFFLLIYGLFDLVLRTIWPQPALLRWLS